MSIREVIIETGNGELFGENILASFICDVDCEYIPHEPETEYSPQEGGYTAIYGYTFKMVVYSSDGKNDLLGSFIKYENLSEEKKKEINKCVGRYLGEYFTKPYG